MVSTRTKGDVPVWDLQDRLAKALKHSGVTNKEMAARLNVSTNTINNYLRGHTTITRLGIEAWADKTGVDVRWLLADYGTHFDTVVGDTKK